ncbi:MAG TPA: FlgD immunoglobulin-like domain containing protein [Candidatus Krumholzibacteria bacterium]|nr:FlgD immunoglobulin-like domain containing protein [Candidatus Krumholzibacteria bacterium]
MTRLATLLLILALAAPALADTIIVPHMLEPSGSLAVEPRPGSVDVQIRAYDTGSLRDDWMPGTNTLQVTLFAADGSLFASTDGTPVCGPCSFPMGDDALAGMSLVEVMVAAGISVMPALGGYMELEVVGGAPEDVLLSARTLMFEPAGGSGGSPIDLRVPCGGGGGSSGQATGRRICVSPDLTENPGSALELPRTGDASLMVACGRDTTSSTVNLYIFDQATGGLVSNAVGEAVCNPCSFPMGGGRAPRKRTLNLEEIITAGGGAIPQEGQTLLAVCEILGDADATTVRAAVLRSRGTTDDLALELMEPDYLDEPATTAVADVARRYGMLRNHPDPFNPQTTLFFELERDDTAMLTVLDLKGRVVRTLETGRLAAGAHQVSWDGRDGRGEALPAGVYLARLRTSTFTTVEKLALIK